MLVKLFTSLCDTSPRFKKFLWRQWYQYLAKGYKKNDWRFMNYGYAADGFNVDLREDYEPDRYSIQLYHRLALDGSLAGKRLLEVGCGRGGGAEYVARTFQPHQMIGIDFSSQAINICKTQRVATGLTFQVGDAESLPFADGSFDVVINVESSHCYGNMNAFLSEVHRVLVPGGLFLLADLRQAEELDLLDTQLSQSGLVMDEREDITPAILSSIELDDVRKKVFIERLVPRRLLASFREFAGVKNSKIDRLLSSGGIKYQRFILRKPN